MPDHPSIDEHLQALHTEAALALQSAVAGHRVHLGQLLQLDLDIMTWEQRLLDRPECDQLSAARRELGFAIYAASGGLYVHAYAGLRLFLELSFAAVYFSANELFRRRWVADREKFSWNDALNESSGILSTHFVQEFSKSAAADAGVYASMAARTYRHCSQFVHGKLAVTRELPRSLAYSDPVLADWLSHANGAAKAVLFLLYARYGDELLPDDQLATTLESAFGHLSEVRHRLGLPVERKGLE